MKLNNKGFAITTILYGVLILFLMLLVSSLGILSSYKDRLAMLLENTNGARDIIHRGYGESLSQEEGPIESPEIEKEMFYAISYNKREPASDAFGFDVDITAEPDVSSEQLNLKFGFKNIQNINNVEMVSCIMTISLGGYVNFVNDVDVTDGEMKKTGLNFPENPFMDVAMFNTSADGNIYQFDTINDRRFENGELFELPVKVNGYGNIVFSNIECADDTSSYMIEEVEVNVGYVEEGEEIEVPDISVITDRSEPVTGVLSFNGDVSYTYKDEQLNLTFGLKDFMNIKNEEMLACMLEVNLNDGLSFVNEVDTSGLDKTKTGFDIPDGSPWTVEEFYPPRFIFEIKQGKTFEEGTLFKLPVKVDGPGEIVFSNIECADDTSSFKINSIRVKVD